MQRFAIPKTRDPFINNFLTHAGVDSETGLQRFWITTWNDLEGCLGALVRADGVARYYEFEKTGTRLGGCGYYSAAFDGDDTMWLCGDISFLCRLTLSTGETKLFPTGMDSYLTGRGMVYDPNTGKLCCSCFHPDGSPTVVFDTREEKVLELRRSDRLSLDVGFSNGDGTYTLRYGECGSGNCVFVRWDPCAKTAKEVLKLESAPLYLARLPRLDGKRYLEGVGWISPDGEICDGIRPSVSDLFWTDSDERYALGCKWDQKNDVTEVWRWDLVTNEVVKLCDFPDSTEYQIALTQDGGAASVNVYGEFRRYDGNGNLVVETKLESDRINTSNEFIRADEHTILGTPFITQRFWTVDTRTGEGIDRGRATAGVGEVMKTWHLNGKVYMASYTKGQITEFDPKKGGEFPENPRVVASPPHSMRPIGTTQNDTTIFSAANHPYGTHGFEFTSYNTVTGEVTIKDDPIPNQQMYTLYYNKKHNLLIGATDSNSDAGMAKKADDHGTVALLDPDTLEVKELFRAPSGDGCMLVLGALDEDRYLIASGFDGWDGPIYKLGVFDLNHPKLELTKVEEGFPIFGCIKYTGVENKFVVREGDTLYLAHTEGFSFVKEREIMTVSGMPYAFAYFVSDGEVFATNGREFFIEEIG